MAAIPLILHVAVQAQALPTVALATRRVRSRPSMLVAGGYLFSLATDLFGRYIAHTYGNNLWVSLVSAAIFTSLLLLAYAEWQVTSTERLAFRIVVAPFLVVFTLLVFALDGYLTFPRYSYPFSTLVTLGGALWTLLRRAYTPSTVPMLRTDWFPILIGIAFHSAVVTITSPIGAALMSAQRTDLLNKVWQLRAALGLVALIVISFGMLRRPADSEVWTR